LDKNVLVLAYLGDSVFEIYVRKYFVEQNINKVKQLQNETTKYVSAKGQALIISEMIRRCRSLTGKLPINPELVIIVCRYIYFHFFNIFGKLKLFSEKDMPVTVFVT